MIKSSVTVLGPHSQFGIMGLQGKNLGLWDYTLFEIGITEIMSEFGIRLNFFMWGNWDYGITPHLKLGLWNYRTPSMGALRVHHWLIIK